MSPVRSEVLAAGTIPWRRTKKGRIKVLLISRRKHRDRSFPKGKLDRGESMPAAAVRETEEEVGLRVTLGANLGTITYRVGAGQQKTVQYWAAEISHKTWKAYSFQANDEVRSVEWVPLQKVRATLSYAADREIFDVFAKLVAEQCVDTYSVIVLRHAKAMPRGAQFPVDELRPLADRGEEQAETLVHALAAFGPEVINTSTAARCTQTVSPLAEFVGVPARECEELSQNSWDRGQTQGLRELVAATVAGHKRAVLCSHRPVIPDLVRELAAATASRPGPYLGEAAQLPPAAFSVFHIVQGGAILGVESYPIKH